MVQEIYQEIWDADQGPNGNGIPALRPNEAQPNAGGFVVVNEVEAATPNNRLFTEVNIPDDKKRTYELCEKLFNNYTLDPGIREQVTNSELLEETEFIETIVKTPAMQAAKSGIAFDRNQPVSAISDATLTDMVREVWFFQGMAGSKHASGFEHVFVGEQKPKGDVPDNNPVSAGGYHFWYKYHLDDAGLRLDGTVGNDQITYGGTRYSGADNPDQGLLVPEVVTLNFQWRAPDFTSSDPTKTQLLSKPIGGFWVGCSPECLIALGVVRTLTRAGKVATINGVTYQLDLHRLTNNSRSIRTFFPRFKRADFSGITPPPSPQPPTPTPPVDDAPADILSDVRVVAALVNPTGSESGREAVTLINASAETAELQGWQIETPNGMRLRIGEVDVAAGSCIRLRLATNDPVLRNRQGKIRLFDKSNELRHEVSYSTEDARREGRTIVF